MIDINISERDNAIQELARIAGSEYACLNSEITFWAKEGTKPTEEEIESKIASMSYARNRQSEYPEIAEQLDQLWHAIDAGKLDKTSDFYKTLKKVKDDSPKPSE